MKEFITETALIFVAVFIVIGCLALFVFGLANVHGRYVCSAYQERTGLETHYQFLDTCYVKHEGEWLRYSAYEKVIIARDGLTQ